jgi:hypothetical protein
MDIAFRVYLNGQNINFMSSPHCLNFHLPRECKTQIG